MATTKAPTRRKAGSRERDVEIERRPGVLILTLARPESRNGLSEAMLRALQEGVGEAAADSGVRAVIIAAKGPAFCAGHDLNELTSRRSDADGGRAYFRHINIDCGCFGTGGGPITFVTLLRNLALLAVACALVRFQAPSARGMG